MQEFLSRVTILGDSVLLFPLSVLLFVYLSFAVSRRAAMTWALWLLACLTAITLAKLGGYAIATVSDYAPVSISGHAAFAALFYASGAVALTFDQSLRTRATVACIAAAIIVAVTVSRWALTAHTSLESVVGAGLGLWFAWAFTSSFAVNRDGKDDDCGRMPTVAAFTTLFVLAGLRLLSNEMNIAIENVLRSMVTISEQTTF